MTKAAGLVGCMSSQQHKLLTLLVPGFKSKTSESFLCTDVNFLLASISRNAWPVLIRATKYSSRWLLGVKQKQDFEQRRQPKFCFLRLRLRLIPHHVCLVFNRFYQATQFHYILISSIRSPDSFWLRSFRVSMDLKKVSMRLWGHPRLGNLLPRHRLQMILFFMTVSCSCCGLSIKIAIVVCGARTCVCGCAQYRLLFLSRNYSLFVCLFVVGLCFPGHLKLPVSARQVS